MTLSDFGTLIAELNIPAIYGPYQNAKSVPYISYTSQDRNVIHADGIVIYGEEWIMLKLVTKSRDLTKEATVESFLTENGIPYDDPDYYFDESQKIHITTYYFLLGPSTADIPHISLADSAVSVEENDTAELTIASVFPADAAITWTSSDPITATVTDGTVTGEDAGTCIIYCSITVDGAVFTDTCTVTVTEPET